MGRREEREYLQSTWMVMREPRDLTGTRRERRARLVQHRRAIRADKGLRVGARVVHADSRYTEVGTIISRNPDGSWTVDWDGPSDTTSFPSKLLVRVEETPLSASAVESSEARRPPAPRDSAADSEGG